MRRLHRDLLLIINLISVYLIFASSSEPIISKIDSPFMYKVFVNSLSGNSIIFNLSMGILVSSIFYFIVVYLPERQKIKDIQPQLEQHISGVITRTWSLVSDVIKYSGKNLELDELTVDEFREACLLVNPKTITQNFHNNGVNSFQKHFGYACANNWNFILSNINDVMHFLPYVDTGIVKILNEIRSSSLSHTIGSLSEIDKLKNSDMSAWSPCIYKIYTLGVKLEKYYIKHVNKEFKHPFWG